MDEMKESVKGILDQYYSSAEALLMMLCTKYGIKASLSTDGNYEAVFTRDAVMAGILGLLKGDAGIVSAFRETLIRLKETQGVYGQIASNYKMEAGVVVEVSYGTLSPKIDAVTWYVIGVSLCVKAHMFSTEEWVESIEKALNLLDAIEYNGCGLIFVPRGGNWADEYDYEGYILYDQVLRAWALGLAAEVFDRAEWEEKKLLIARTIEVNFWPAHERITDDVVYHRRIYARLAKQKHYYFKSALDPSGYLDVFDLAANALMGVVFPNHEKMEIVFAWIDREFLKHDQLPPAFHPVVKPGQARWEKLKNFHLFEFRNKPYHYHNGGIWWIWIGWLALSLALNKKQKMHETLMTVVEMKLAELSDFTFEEYLEGEFYQARGTPNMAYSGTGLLLCKWSAEMLESEEKNITKL